jgi:hypothetical protein
MRGGVIGGGHRIAPARPNADLPPNYDNVNMQLFKDEFDAYPLPDQAEAAAAMLKADSTNQLYIRSMIPTSVVFNYEQFYERMARNPWRGASPSAQAQSRGFVRPVGSHRDLGTNPMLQDASRPATGFGQNEWSSIPGLQRVNAYAFRGEKRRPEEVRAGGGFMPPSMRTDDFYVGVIADKFVGYMKRRFNKTVDKSEVVNWVKGQGGNGRAFVEYEIWRAILKGEEMNIGKMVAFEFLKGFISTSRNVQTAHTFWGNTSDGGSRRDGAVYAVHTEGGFLLPDKITTGHVHGSKENEAEIAHPGPLPWLKIMAFRTYNKVDFNDARTFPKSQFIFVRKGFPQADPSGFSKVFAALGSLPLN